MESPLSQEYIHVPKDDIRGQTEVLVRPHQFRSARQLVWVDYARPPTSEGHISFVRTPIWVLLDSMEIPLSQEYIHLPEGDIRCQTEVLYLGRQFRSAHQFRSARLG